MTSVTTTTRKTTPRMRDRAAAVLQAAGPPLAAGALLLGLLAGWVGLGGFGTLVRERLEVTGATVPVPASPGVTAAYLTISNTGADADQLLAVSTGAARQALLTRNTVNGASGGMIGLSALTVPGHGSVALGPFGTDIMLVDPGPLTAGHTVTLHLEFRRAGTLTVNALITAPGSA